MKSLLFVPSKEKMLNKITTFNADVYIVDLEDSIIENEKMTALQEAHRFLERNCGDNILIRVDGKHIEEELEYLQDVSFYGYMLPKFEEPDRYEGYRKYFAGKVIVALVETPKGIVNIKKIAESDLVDGIAFGAEDFTSSVGMKNCADSLRYARSTVVTFGKAYGKKVFDTPSFVIDDGEKLKEEIQIAVDLGFNGKLAIHPNQAEIINSLFQYYDFEFIKNIVEQYDSSGEAVLKIGETVYEKMHIAHYKRILRENDIK